MEQTPEAPPDKQIQLETQAPPRTPQEPVLAVKDLTLLTPNSQTALIRDLTFEVSVLNLAFQSSCVIHSCLGRILC